MGEHTTKGKAVQEWAEKYVQSFLGKLVQVKDAGWGRVPLRYEYGLVMEIDPTRYGGSKHPQQCPAAYVLWADGTRVWEPCVYLEPASK